MRAWYAEKLARQGSLAAKRAEVEEASWFDVLHEEKRKKCQARIMANFPAHMIPKMRVPFQKSDELTVPLLPVYECPRDSPMDTRTWRPTLKNISIYIS